MRDAWGAAPRRASEAVGKFLKHRLLSANLGLPVVSKKQQYSCLFGGEYHNFDRH